MPLERPSRKLHFRFDSFQIHLETNDWDLETGFRLLFQDWPAVSLPSSEPEEVKLHLQFTLIDRLPDPPERHPSAIEEISGQSGGAADVSLNWGEHDLSLRLNQIAVIYIPHFDRLAGEIVTIDVLIARSAISASRLEDIFFTSIAPVLRRHGYYLVHAFAVAKDDRAILFVGPSGCGKTTTGLSLVTSGWGYLSNDVVLLKEKAGLIWAFPTPGGIGLKSPTVDLISGLENIRLVPLETRQTDRIYLPATQIISGWAQAAPIDVICFPQIGQETNSQYDRLNKAAALARLLESSVDRWDRAFLKDHIMLLEKLCEEADCYLLHLGQDVDELPKSMSEVWGGSGFNTES